jgi:hypothetical protein
MKLLIQHILYLFFLASILTSCSNKGVFIPNGQPLESIDFAARIGQMPNSDPYEVKNIFLDANLMYITVNYETSCSGKDVVEMIGSEVLSDAMVPVRQVKLAIRSSDATCKEFRNRTFIVNIRELAGMKERDFETDLQIYGWRSKVRYVFVP